ncbi:sporulation-like protein [Gammaproteobacteria bacterium MFB021]|nr:sporulation-like protein [Gammaproteobacteria bacterium MFB021]
MARRPAQNSRAAPKGATTRARARSSGNSQGVSGIPGWLWAIAGLIGGFALSQYLDHTSPEPVAAVVPKPASQSSSSATSGGAGSSESGKAGTSSAQPATPTFEFYTLLPETEVIAPNSSSGSSSSPEASAKASQEAAADDAANQTKQPAATGSYMLQAASFRDIADAERLANRLKDFGLLAKITDVRANGNQIWHRVQVGPYRDTRELNRAQDLMVTQGIEPLMIRLQN